MKRLKMQIVMALGVLAVSVVTQASVLPEFMNARQLVVWRAQQTPAATAAVQASDEQALFFTGKPYDSASGTYLFKYRSYNPALARWTSADPSGFPDGANNFAYCNNRALVCFDIYGLAVLLTSHQVGLSGTEINHLAIELVPDDPSAFQNVPGFTLLPDGNFGRIISAVPNLQNGMLTEKNNNTTDLNNSPVGDVQALPSNMLGTGSDTALINQILNAYSQYNNNLPYTPLPNPDNNGYNSNSYIAGILQAAGAYSRAPLPFPTPGFAKPIPLKKTYIPIE